MWVTDGVSDKHCLFSKLDVWEWCQLLDDVATAKDANSKLVEVVTVADVDDEDRVGNSLLQIWKLRFGHKTKLLFRLWAQGLVNILKLGLTKILSLSLVKILMLSWDLDVSAWLKLWNCLIKICVITCDMNSILGSVVPFAMFYIFHILTFVACIHDLVTWPTSWRFGHLTTLQTSPHSPPTTLELVKLQVLAQAKTPASLSPRHCPSRPSTSRTLRTWSRTSWGAHQASLRRERWR